MIITTDVRSSEALVDFQLSPTGDRLLAFSAKGDLLLFDLEEASGKIVAKERRLVVPSGPYDGRFPWSRTGTFSWRGDELLTADGWTLTLPQGVASRFDGPCITGVFTSLTHAGAMLACLGAQVSVYQRSAGRLPEWKLTDRSPEPDLDSSWAPWGQAQAIDYSERAHALAVLTSSGLRIWTRSGNSVVDIGQAASVAFKFSPAGDMLAVGRSNGNGSPTLEFYRVQGDKPLSRFASLVLESSARELSFSADSQVLFVADDDESLRSYDTLTGQETAEYGPRHRDPVASPDPGSHLLAYTRDPADGGSESTTCILDTAARSEEHCLEGAQSLVGFFGRSRLLTIDSKTISISNLLRPGGTLEPPNLLDIPIADPFGRLFIASSTRTQAYAEVIDGDLGAKLLVHDLDANSGKWLDHPPHQFSGYAASGTFLGDSEYLGIETLDAIRIWKSEDDPSVSIRNEGGFSSFTMLTREEPSGVSPTYYFERLGRTETFYPCMIGGTRYSLELCAGRFELPGVAIATLGGGSLEDVLDDLL